MTAGVRAASVEVGQLRELLASDRGLSGEARAAREQAPLETVAYRKPLRVRLRRRFQRDRRLRARARYFVLLSTLMLTLALYFWLSGRAHAALAAASHGAPSGRVVESMAASVAGPSGAMGRAVVAPEPQVTPVAHAETIEAAALSAHRRLQRADLWLRVETPRAAHEARTLIESALAELPGSVHGQVALAQACLRLGDEGCARTAIHKAVLARPWRAKYRALAQDIDRQFAAERSAPPTLQGSP